MKRKKTIAIIPARKGSVGIPGKNHKLIGGRPLIEYTIQEAIKSRKIDDIIVSTDCAEIMSISRKYGERLIILERPSELAKSDSRTEDVVSHACDFYQQRNEQIRRIILLQPTSPIRSSEQIDESLQLFDECEKKTLVSVTEPIQHPFDFIVEQGGVAKYLCRIEGVYQRQEFSKTWFMNGAIYITDFEFFSKENKIYTLSNCFFYKMPNESSIDIDTPFDLKLSELIINDLKGQYNDRF